MRIAFLSLLCVGLFLVSSCGKDDDAGITLSQDDVVGTWNVAKLDTDAEILVANVGTTTSSSLTGSSVTMTFNSDGTWVSAGDFTNQVTTALGTVDNAESGIGSGTWRVSGGSIILIGLELNNGSAPTETEELDFRVDGFTAEMNVDLMASPDNVVRVLGIASGFKAEIELDLAR